MVDKKLHKTRMSVKRYIQLYKLYAKMDFAWLLRDSVFALLAILADIISNIAAVTGVFLLAWRFDGIGGMNKYEVLFMLAYSTIVTGIFQLFFSGNNTGHISRRIGRGQLEHMFIQPIPLRAQLLTEGFIPFSGSSNLMSGIVILCVAIHNLHISVTWWWILTVIVNLLITMIIILSLSYLFSFITFYAPSAAEEISTYVIDSTGSISTFPLSGMPLYLQIPLITIIPSGLMAWFPTLSILGKPPLGLPAMFPLVFAILLCSLASIFFQKGLNYYAKKGSNRYSAIGHRR